MVARSYEEAQAQRAVELAEVSFDEIEDTLWQLAQLVSKEGGEVYLPAFERVQAEYDAQKERMAMIQRARQIAAAPKPKRSGKRSAKARRASVRG